ncbi:MAG: hypothetical protein ACLFRD_05045 [Nitriliruptoraceae bacterium]
MAETLSYALVLLAALAVQVAVIYVVFRARERWRRARGLPPVDTSPKVDPLTWGRLTRARRGANDASPWTPLGDPRRLTREARASRRSGDDGSPPSGEAAH